MEQDHQPPAQQQQQRRVYLGKPENKKDPSALQGQAKAKPPVKKQRQPMPKQLPKPSNMADQQQTRNVVFNTEDPMKSSVFTIGANVREISLDTTIEPTSPASIEVSRDTYREMVIDDSNIQKSILPEYMDYYLTGLLWCRITALKDACRQVLTPEEVRLLRVIENTTFSVPEPILYQLRIFGRTQTPSRENLRPRFPQLPTNRVAGFGGYYGPINIQNHNDYEEIPCLGVLAEAVRHSVSNEPPGRYPSSLAGEGIVPNDNLLGYRPLGNRRGEAKNLAFDAGITPDNFPESVPGTGFNMTLMLGISGVLAQSKTFKVTNVNLNTMSELGSVVQTSIQKIIPDTSPLEKQGEIYTHASYREQDSMYMLGIVYAPNLYKEASTRETAQQWCCINNPPQGMIDNRNAKRANYPGRITEPVFRSLSQQANEYREKVIRALVLTNR